MNPRSLARIFLAASILLPALGLGLDSPAEVRLRKGDRIVALGDSITQAGGYLDLLRRVFALHYY